MKEKKINTPDHVESPKHWHFYDVCRKLNSCWLTCESSNNSMQWFKRKRSFQNFIMYVHLNKTWIATYHICDFLYCQRSGKFDCFRNMEIFIVKASNLKPHWNKAEIVQLNFQFSRANVLCNWILSGIIAWFASNRFYNMIDTIDCRY